jgi:hypothetical protein
LTTTTATITTTTNGTLLEPAGSLTGVQFTLPGVAFDSVSAADKAALEVDTIAALLKLDTPLKAIDVIGVEFSSDEFGNLVAVAVLSSRVPAELTAVLTSRLKDASSKSRFIPSVGGSGPITPQTVVVAHTLAHTNPTIQISLPGVVQSSDLSEQDLQELEDELIAVLSASNMSSFDVSDVVGLVISTDENGVVVASLVLTSDSSTTTSDLASGIAAVATAVQDGDLDGINGIDRTTTDIVIGTFGSDDANDAVQFGLPGISMDDLADGALAQLKADVVNAILASNTGLSESDIIGVELRPGPDGELTATVRFAETVPPGALASTAVAFDNAVTSGKTTLSTPTSAGFDATNSKGGVDVTVTNAIGTKVEEIAFTFASGQLTDLTEDDEDALKAAVIAEVLAASPGTSTLTADDILGAEISTDADGNTVVIVSLVSKSTGDAAAVVAENLAAVAADVDFGISLESNGLTASSNFGTTNALGQGEQTALRLALTEHTLADLTLAEQDNLKAAMIEALLESNPELSPSDVIGAVLTADEEGKVIATIPLGTTATSGQDALILADNLKAALVANDELLALLAPPTYDSTLVAGASGFAALLTAATPGSVVLNTSTRIGFSIGDTIVIAPGSTSEEFGTITGFGSIIVADGVASNHAAGTIVILSHQEVPYISVSPDTLDEFGSVGVTFKLSPLNLGTLTEVDLAGLKADVIAAVEATSATSGIDATQIVGVDITTDNNNGVIITVVLDPTDGKELAESGAKAVQDAIDNGSVTVTVNNEDFIPAKVEPTTGGEGDETLVFSFPSIEASTVSITEATKFKEDLINAIIDSSPEPLTEADIVGVDIRDDGHGGVVVVVPLVPGATPTTVAAGFDGATTGTPPALTLTVNGSPETPTNVATPASFGTIRAGVELLVPGIDPSELSDDETDRLKDDVTELIEGFADVPDGAILGVELKAGPKGELDVVVAFASDVPQAVIDIVKATLKTRIDNGDLAITVTRPNGSIKTAQIVDSVAVVEFDASVASASLESDWVEYVDPFLTQIQVVLDYPVNVTDLGRQAVGANIADSELLLYFRNAFMGALAPLGYVSYSATFMEETRRGFTTSVFGINQYQRDTLLTQTCDLCIDVQDYVMCPTLTTEDLALVPTTTAPDAGSDEAVAQAECLTRRVQRLSFNSASLQDDAEATAGMSNGALAGIALAVIIIGGLVIGFIVLKKKKEAVGGSKVGPDEAEMGSLFFAQTQVPDAPDLHPDVLAAAKKVISSSPEKGRRLSSAPLSSPGSPAKGRRLSGAPLSLVKMPMPFSSAFGSLSSAAGIPGAPGSAGPGAQRRLALRPISMPKVKGGLMPSSLGPLAKPSGGLSPMIQRRPLATVTRIMPGAPPKGVANMLGSLAPLTPRGKQSDA